MASLFRFTGRPVDENDLQAFVDGALSGRRRRRVEEHLVRHPEDAARLDQYGQHVEILRALRAEPAEFPEGAVCSELVRAFDERLARRRRLRRSVAAAVVLLCALSAGVTSTLLLGSRDAATPLVAARDEPAWLFHSSLMEEVRPVRAERSDGLAWLDERLGRPVLRRPQLEALGLRFVSGTVLHATEPPVVRLIYEDELGKRLFIYVAVLVTDTDGAFGVVPEGYVSLQWRRGPVVFALIAPSDSPQLTATMEVVSAALVEEPVADTTATEAGSPRLDPGIERAAVQSGGTPAAPEPPGAPAPAERDAGTDSL